MTAQPSMNIPPEFQRFTLHFADLSPDYSWPFEKSMELAFTAVPTQQEKLALKAFMDQLLDGTHSGAELARLWNNSGARIGFGKEDAIAILGYIRSELIEKIALGE